MRPVRADIPPAAAFAPASSTAEPAYGTGGRGGLVASGIGVFQGVVQRVTVTVVVLGVGGGDGFHGFKDRDFGSISEKKIRNGWKDIYEPENI